MMVQRVDRVEARVTKMGQGLRMCLIVQLQNVYKGMTVGELEKRRWEKKCSPVARTQ